MMNMATQWNLNEKIIIFIFNLVFNKDPSINIY